MLRKLLFTATALVAFTTASPAAIVGNFGTDPTSAAGAFSNDPNGAGVGGTFFDQYLFDISTDSTVLVTNATNTFAAGGITGPFGIQNFTGAIYEIVGAVDLLPGGNDILRFGPQAAVLNPGGLSQSLNGIGEIAAGNYYLAIAGNAGSTAGYGGNLSVAAIGAVPEISTWAMLLLGFSGMIVMGTRTRRREGCDFRLA
jgi:hypothetical protein